MHQQPESSSSTLIVGPAPISVPSSDPASGSPSAPNGAAQPPQHVPRWLQRFELLLRVLLRSYIGVIAFIAPWWWQGFWDRNPLFLHFQTLGDIARTGAVRGIISGLGLLNLWIALQDAIRHRDS